MKRKTEAAEITLASVARKARVCVTTASRVLNDIPSKIPISEESRQKVLKAVFDLGYIPSHAGRILRHGKTKAIGILGNAPDSFEVTNDWTAIVLNALLETAAQRQYNLTFLTGQTQPLDAWELLKAVGTVDAVLVVNMDLEREAELVTLLKKLRKPIVYAIAYPKGPHVYAAAADDEAGGKMTAEFLMNKGHRRIAIVRSEGYRGVFDLREKGALDAIKKRGLEVSKRDCVLWNEITPDVVTKQKWTAAICLNEPILYSLASQYKTAGKDLASELEVTVFSLNAQERRFSPRPNFSSVQQPLAKIISGSLEMAIRLIEGKKVLPTRRLFPFTLYPFK